MADAGKSRVYGKIYTMIGLVVGAMAIIGSSVGAYVFVDDRYVAVADYKAQTEEIFKSMKQFNKRLEQKIIEDKLAYWEQRRDRYRVRAGADNCGEYRAECLEAERQINMLRRQLQAYR